MSITVLVQVVETHLVEEEFRIESLPEDWEDMTLNDQWSHVVRHGNYEQSDTVNTNVEFVHEIIVEEVST